MGKKTNMVQVLNKEAPESTDFLSRLGGLGVG